MKRLYQNSYLNNTIKKKIQKIYNPKTLKQLAIKKLNWMIKN